MTDTPTLANLADPTRLGYRYVVHVDGTASEAAVRAAAANDGYLELMSSQLRYRCASCGSHACCPSGTLPCPDAAANPGPYTHDWRPAGSGKPIYKHLIATTN